MRRGGTKRGVRSSPSPHLWRGGQGVRTMERGTGGEDLRAAERRFRAGRPATFSVEDAMNRLPLPGGRTVGSGVGHFRVAVQIGNRSGERFENMEALVDTGATYTWIPRDVLQQLGVAPEEEWPFLLADAREGGRPSWCSGSPAPNRSSAW